MYLQDVILALHRFWAGHGCLIAELYDVEKGAGTMNPHTFFRALGPEPWAAAYDEPFQMQLPTSGRKPVSNTTPQSH